MGRKKSKPVRSGSIADVLDARNRDDSNVNTDNSVAFGALDQENNDSDKQLYVDIDQSNWSSNEHFDIAEIVLKDVRFSEEETGIGSKDCSRTSSDFSLRFRLCGVKEGNLRFGRWLELPVDDVFLEYLYLEKSGMAGSSKPVVVLSGVFDGPREGVSGLVRLVSLKFLALRPVLGAGDLLDAFRVRVEILESAFEACGSLLETTRNPLRNSMMNVMSWLRPEVTTSESKYGFDWAEAEEGTVSTKMADLGKDTGFDAASFYESIKPSKDEPVLEDELPDLLPKLRPYQHRAACWMVRREKATSEISKQAICDEMLAPFCLCITSLEGNNRMFYNPFSGNVSLQPESHFTYFSGGILADEMGLGKTVELLACIFAHRKQLKDVVKIPSHVIQNEGKQLKQLKRERVECVCGATSERCNYEGLWVQCDNCYAWQHADCVGYSPRNRFISKKVENLNRDKNKRPRKRTKENDTIVMEVDGRYTCGLCSEPEASNSNVSTAATLIVCPETILEQWHSEIFRHTRPGSLKISIYEGARNIESSENLRAMTSELASSDIVLTTYDVLRADLAHDNGRHNGEHRSLRFQKRYPVVPTILTKINWWRLCLDEAQMVEGSNTAGTEMAMRLCAQHRWCITGTPIQRKLDDIYGLLRFLRASPFDVYRWWNKVIRDPYERRDAIAMRYTHKIFKHFMWRSSKAHVSDELQLPGQVEHVSWLTLSSIEEHFYQKQHETCMGCAREIIKKFKDNTDKRKSVDDSDVLDGFLSSEEVAKLLFPLLKLRQACCHPQVGSSGLCSLQRSPLTMGEILEVLIGKTKTEGEEALRRIVVALNGLAALSIIEQDQKQAAQLYREGLNLAEENFNDFRLDPLLSLHIHHNLAELLSISSDYVEQCRCKGSHPSENDQEKKRKGSTYGTLDQFHAKSQKVTEENTPGLAASERDSEQLMNHNACSTGPETTCDDQNVCLGVDAQRLLSKCFADECLRKTCSNIKQKFLSLFTSKLLSAQKDFKNANLQTCSIIEECDNQSMFWWLHALDNIEGNKESSEELLKRIDQAISDAFNSLEPLRSSRFGSVSGLKYAIHSRLDALKASRNSLIERLLEIDRTMVNPNDGDVELVRYCPNCSDGYGPLCIHCELDGLFKLYETRLFVLRKDNDHSVISSVEEALDLEKQRSELNRFFRNSKLSAESDRFAEKNKQRSVRTGFQVSRNPSELEITLGVIKSYTKSNLGRQGLEFAKKHLLLFEAMRKEFAQARFLSLAQAQMLCAHVEIKWATSRLRLVENENEPAAIDVLSREELIPSSIQFSSDKFLAVSSLERTRGQLRYLKGLVSTNNPRPGCSDLSVIPQDGVDLPSPQSAREESKCDDTTSANEPCPICHDTLTNQKMVFQCGHVICCKCCLKLMERVVARQQKWIMCPTCRQPSDTNSIAYADERQNMVNQSVSRGRDVTENTIVVRGSYGTKVEAVTRRILWIASLDREAKVIVFSSWNDVLDVLEHSLNANSITYVRMKGGRKSHAAIARFKGRKPEAKNASVLEKRSPGKDSIQVLLMLIQHGANGLNILEAQHVVLMEPLLNPAAEAQAISRVHRIGQEKTTHVHRFLVKNTVEESIYKLYRGRNMSSILGINKPKDPKNVELTLQDVEFLFPSETVTPAESRPEGGLSHLAPSVAAGLAAERRLLESHSSGGGGGIAGLSGPSSSI